MERRKGIPLVALVIFIALLVAIILTCVIILGANKNDKQNKETQTQAIGEQTPPPEEPEDVTLESEDLINADQDVRDAYKLTGNGKTYAKYALYSSGGFDETKNNTKNNLKLKLAMAQVSNSDMDKSSTTKSIPKDKITEYTKKIFSNIENLEYKDLSNEKIIEIINNINMFCFSITYISRIQRKHLALQRFHNLQCFF